jgi:hypothetical protein
MASLLDLTENFLFLNTAKIMTRYRFQFIVTHGDTPSLIVPLRSTPFTHTHLHPNPLFNDF